MHFSNSKTESCFYVCSSRCMCNRRGRRYVSFSPLQKLPPLLLLLSFSLIAPWVQGQPLSGESSGGEEQYWWSTGSRKLRSYVPPPRERNPGGRMSLDNNKPGKYELLFPLRLFFKKVSSCEYAHSMGMLLFPLRSTSLSASASGRRRLHVVHDGHHHQHSVHRRRF